MKSWVIGNWKLNPTSVNEVHQLASTISASVGSFHNCHTMIAPNFIHLSIINAIVKNTTLKLASQDVTALTESAGAYTGDVSAAQLEDIGVQWVIVGHSERRQYYNESNDTLFKKISHCMANNLGVVFCIGESEADYDKGQTKEVLAKQLEVIKSLVIDSSGTNDPKLNTAKLIVAYEPVWAIGTGKVPSVEEVAQVHTFIRKFLIDSHADLATLPIIYGGSVNPDNAANFAKCDEIDGVLVGGAALDAQSFLNIIKSFDTTVPSL